MNNNLFTIEFFFNAKCNGETPRSKVFKYRASIKLVSKNFQLFEVSQIERMEEDAICNVKDSYLVTSYPYYKNDDWKWRDASNFKSTSFLRIIGSAIENSLSAVN